MFVRGFELGFFVVFVGNTLLVVVIWVLFEVCIVIVR